MTEGRQGGKRKETEGKLWEKEGEGRNVGPLLSYFSQS